MGNITEQEIYTENVPQVEIDDPVAGGASGPVNLLGKALANRTKWLKAQITSAVSRISALETKVGNTAMTDVLLKAQNLADLPDKAAARTNLGVSASDHNHDAAYLKKGMNLGDVENALSARTNIGVADIHFVASAPAAPLGKNGDVAFQQIINGTTAMYKKKNGVWIPQVTSQNTELPGVFKWFCGVNVPTGYLKCNGQAVSRTTYAELFAAIGTRYGLGDGGTTFNLPDVRGDAVRGYDDGRGIDPGRAMGSEQADELKGHSHNLDGGKAVSAGGHIHEASSGGAGSHGHTGNTTSGGNHGHQYGDIYWSEQGGTVITGGFGQGDGNDFDNKGYEIIRTTQYAGTHSHTLDINGVSDHTHAITLNNAGVHEHALSGNTQPTGGSETRMRNIAFMGIIKY